MNDFDKSKEKLIHELNELRFELKNSKELCHQQHQELRILRHKDDRFIEFSNLLPEIIFETNSKGKLVLINKPAMELTGYTREDFNKGIYAIEMLAEQDTERARSHMENILNGKPQPQAEFLAQRKDKSTFPILVHSMPILKNGKVIGMRGIIYDLSEDKKRENQNKYFNQERHIIINKSGIEIAVIDYNGKIDFLNDYSAQSFHVSAEKIIGKKLSALFPKEVANAQLANIRRVIESGQEYLHETRLPVDGSWRWYFANLQPFHSSDGKINKVMVIAQNITEKKHAEEKLNEHKTMAKILMDSANESIFLIDRNLKILIANPSAARRLNVKVEDLIGKNLREIPQYSSNKPLCENRSQKINQVLKTGIPVHFSDSRDEFFFDISIYPIVTQGNISSLAIYCRDITDQKKAENALRLSEERLRRVVQNMPVMMIAFDDDQNIIVWNRECELITGYLMSDIIGNSDTIEFTYPNSTLHDKMVSEWATRGNYFRNWENTITCKNGSEKTIAWSNISKHFPIPGWATWGIGIDITKRKQFEKALSKSEEQYRLVFENSTEAILVIQDRRLKFFNPRTEEFTGYSHQDLINLSILKIIHPEDKASIVKLGKRQWTTSHASKIQNIRIITKPGKIRWFEIGIVKIQWQGRPALLNFAVDITQQKEMEAEQIKLQQQLFQTQKMELIGRLASGIAHDFNNLLSPIISYLTLTLMEVSSKDPLYLKINHILELSRQAQSLTRHLLAFGRKQDMILNPVNLNDEITQFNKILRHLVNRNIDIKTILAPSLELIKADSSQIHQILMNLVINAQDAMPNGGKLIIETVNVTIFEEKSQELPKTGPGQYVMLAVSDNGHGMDKQTLEKIFEPFYTTKGRCKGTGLGLTTIQQIMNQYNGSISVCSEPQKGATFKLYFPVGYSEKSTVNERVQPNFSYTTPSDGLILIVDDDEKCLSLIEDVLVKMNHNVLKADGPQKALTLAKEYGKKIQLLITDVNMTELNGKELFNKLRDQNLKLKVLFISGYLKEMVDIVENNFLQKPFSAQQLLAKVNTIFAS